MRRLFAIVVVLFLAVVHAAAAPSEDPAGFVVRGKVLDPTRAPLAGAVVTAASDARGATQSTVTDLAGNFTLLLNRGTYTIRISSAGFLDSVMTITATDGGGETREVVLRLAGVSENVTVSARAADRPVMITSATKTATPLRDVPQSITVVPKELIKDQLMTSVGDVVRYVPGITYHQGENNRDQVIIRGNSSSADFFVDGVRDDVQYYRDLYNLDRVEALKGPNAMIFGRGGGGGVINRVLKRAEFQPTREFTFQFGQFGNKRITADLDHPVSDRLALRLNGMFESSGSFRDAVTLERGGINPTLTFTPGDRTTVAVGYEFLRDARVADRGITSYRGRPADVDIATFYGNPADSRVRAHVNLAWANVERRFGRAVVRNRTLVGGYDRFYQNFVPGAASADRSQVALTAYNNATNRLNVFNQTDIVYTASTGAVRHTLLAGTELGRQSTDNFRNTGFFNDQASSILVPFGSPQTAMPVTFRQNATDADNHVGTTVAAVFAQDQVELSRYVQLIGGLRFDRFDLRYHNNRTGDTLRRPDDLVSPRAGIVFKPATAVSLYGSYTVSYLPSSGDQLSSLTAITQQVEPEKFDNYEVGLKWDAFAALSLTTAVYRLDRTNTRATDPNDPTRIVQTGSQRTNGYELGVTGQPTPAWSVAGGYAYQDAFVTSATVSARAGAQVGQVPHHTLSLWNNYRFHPRFGVGVGIIHRSDMFAAIDNTVTLPGYTRADVAAFFTLRRGMRVQANVENVFDTKYFVNADSNTNISPGFPRAVRVALTTVF